MKKSVLVLLLAAVAVELFSAVPSMLNFPGKLTNTTGNPISGIKTIAFTFFDAETGGSQKWTGSYSVNVEKGIFNVVLGSGAYPFSLALDFSQDYWLEMKVESEVLLPRQRIMSVAYAMRSEFANRAETPMVISGCGDIDENVSEKLYFQLAKMPRSITLYLYGEKYNTQYYTELAAHDHGTTGTANLAHSHSVSHGHKILVDGGGGSAGVWGALSGALMSLISTENPISSSALSDHSHSTFTAGVSCTAAITTSQKMFLNDMRIFCDGENISNEVTGAFLSKTSLTKFGDGTQNHQFNTTAGSGPMDITSQIATVGQHYFIFKQSGLNQGGRIRYYLYVTY